MTFIERLNSLIKEHNITRKELSKQLQIGINQIKYWENKNIVPNRVTQKVIADYFGVSAEYLLGQSDERQPIIVDGEMFTDRIQQLADLKGVTIAKMLKDLNMGQGTFSTWKKRGTTPNGEVLQKISDYFGVSVDYLLGKADDRELTQNKKEPPTEDESLSEQKQKLLERIAKLNDDQAREVEEIVDYILAKKKQENQ